MNIGFSSLGFSFSSLTPFCVLTSSRTALTRNPRVDFISKRVEEIKSKKSRVSSLANSAKSQLKQAQKTMVELDRTMLDAFKDELGEREWDDSKGTYTRVLHSEEKRLVQDMERVLSRCRETMDKVIGAYLEHLDDTSSKPLTYNTPDEDVSLTRVMQTKEEYKSARTLYSDAMIDVDADLAAGGNPTPGKQQRVDEAKRTYDEMSDRLCDDALRYEKIYREELSQRVSAHFMAEQHLLRGVSTAMKDFLPYTRGLTLDWEEMRNTRRVNLAAAKRGDYGDDGTSSHFASALPEPGAYDEGHGKRDGMRRDSSSSNPFGNMGNRASDLTSSAKSSASAASAAIAKAGKNTSKSISEIVSSYAAKPATKSALDNVKL